MQNKSASVQVNSNVTITVLDKNNEVIQTVHKHNKATVLMVEGILHFLQGWYSNTSFNEKLGGGSPEDSSVYIPTSLGFGNIGVQTVKDGDNLRRFIGVARSAFVEPTFNSLSLQSPLMTWSEEGKSDLDSKKVKYTLFSESEITSYEDINNSESLRFITRISPGQLVGERVYIETGDQEGEGSSEFRYEPYDKSFLDPRTEKWTTIITEIGLFSDHDNLLARVLLDSEVIAEELGNDSNGNPIYSYKFIDDDSPTNPVVQTEETTLVVEWRIGLISIGDNDTFVTQSSIEYQELAKALSAEYTNYMSNHLDEEGKSIPPSPAELEKMLLNILSPTEQIFVPDTNN